MSEQRNRAPKAYHDPEDTYAGMVVDGPMSGTWHEHWYRTFQVGLQPPVRLSPNAADNPPFKDVTLFYRYVDPDGQGNGGVWRLTDESLAVWEERYAS